MTISLPIAALALVSVLGVSFVAGRITHRVKGGRRLADWRTYLAIGFVLLTVNGLIGTSALVHGLADSNRQLDCRADLASPVNDATSDLNVATGRGLATTVAYLLKKPELTAAVKQELGDAGVNELTRQTNAILSASASLEAANKARGNPVSKCKR